MITGALFRDTISWEVRNRFGFLDNPDRFICLLCFFNQIADVSKTIIEIKPTVHHRLIFLVFRHPIQNEICTVVEQNLGDRCRSRVSFRQQLVDIFVLFIGIGLYIV